MLRFVRSYQCGRLVQQAILGEDYRLPADHIDIYCACEYLWMQSHTCQLKVLLWFSWVGPIKFNIR